MSSFKLKYTLEERELECKKIIKKYPTRIPIICEKSKNSNAVNLDKNKYLIPDNFSFSQFIYIIRKRLKLQPEQGLFFFINNELPLANQMMRDIYEKYKDEDGFLYVTYSKENIFGSK